MGGPVPTGFAEQVNATMACMRGTANQPPRCAALRGEVGIKVTCAIYQWRPSPCRAFSPLAAVGMGDDACNDARRRHGLAPLLS